VQGRAETRSGPDRRSEIGGDFRLVQSQRRHGWARPSTA
jgi:hypothetical protein